MLHAEIEQRNNNMLNKLVNINVDLCQIKIPGIGNLT